MEPRSVRAAGAVVKRAQQVSGRRRVRGGHLPRMVRWVEDIPYDTNSELYGVRPSPGVKNVDAVVDAQAADGESGIRILPVVPKDGFLLEVECAGLQRVAEAERPSGERGGAAGMQAVAHGIRQNALEEGG